MADNRPTVRFSGPNQADPFGWDEKDEDLFFSQDNPVSGRFAQQRKLRMMAQEAALKEVASSKLRRLLAYDRLFNCADVKIGDTALS